MNELNGGASLMPLISGIAFALVGLIAWFYVNRASVRANEQVRLLQALLEEQKKQTAMLQRLTEQTLGTEENGAEGSAEQDFTRLIPER